MDEQTEAVDQKILKDITIRATVNGGFVIVTSLRKVEERNGENVVVGATADEHVASTPEAAIAIASSWLK